MKIGPEDLIVPKLTWATTSAELFHSCLRIDPLMGLMSQISHFQTKVWMNVWLGVQCVQIRDAAKWELMGGWKG